MRFATLTIAVAILVGCASGPARRPSAMLPLAARSTPRDYIVVTVRNPIAVPPPRVASTPRGYDGNGPYIAGGPARTTSRALAADYGLEQVASWPIAVLGVHCLVYRVPRGADRRQLVAGLRRDRRVDSAESMRTFVTEAQPYNDPYASLQDNLRQLSVPAAQRLTLGRGARIALIDTGADLDHPDLRSARAVGENFVDRNRATFREDPHGTAVAGVIAATPNNAVGIAGIAPEARLFVYKACWRGSAGIESVCDSFTIARALAAAIEAHADVINLSLGGPSDPLLTRLVEKALAEGAIVVGAMPRDGVRHGFPVAIDGVIAVDVDGRGARTAGVLHAPGSDIVSLAPGGHYDFYSGSSLAAAEISGIILLLRAEHPRLSSREALVVLAGTEAARAAGPDACAALEALNPRGSCSMNATAAESECARRAPGGLPGARLPCAAGDHR